MTDLTTTNVTSLPTRSREPSLPEKLDALLMAGDSPVIGPNNAQALRDWLEQSEAFERNLERPTQARVETMVTRLSIATVKRAISEAEADEGHDLYWLVLKDVPLVDLAAAFTHLLRTSKFMPKPSEINEVARQHSGRRAFRRSRARWLIRKHEFEWVPPVSEPAIPDDVQAIKAQAAQDLAANRPD